MFFYSCMQTFCIPIGFSLFAILLTLEIPQTACSSPFNAFRNVSLVNPLFNGMRMRQIFIRRSDRAEDLYGYQKVDRNVLPDRTIVGRPRYKCPRRKIENGLAVVRDKGTLVRYRCMDGFSLYGANRAVCMRNQWSSDTPLCVRPGCRRILGPAEAEMFLSFGGAVAVFMCNEGYKMDGNRMLYCDGRNWNGTEPTCTAPTTTTTTEVPEIALDVNEIRNTTIMEDVEAWDLNTETEMPLPSPTTVTHEALSGMIYSVTEMHPTVPTDATTTDPPDRLSTLGTISRTLPSSDYSPSTFATEIGVIVKEVSSLEETTVAETREQTASTIYTSPTTAEANFPNLESTSVKISKSEEMHTPSVSTFSTLDPAEAETERLDKAEAETERLDKAEAETERFDKAEASITDLAHSKPSLTTEIADSEDSQTTTTTATSPVIDESTETAFTSLKLSSSAPSASLLPLTDKSLRTTEGMEYHVVGVPEFIQPILPQKLDPSNEQHHILVKISTLGGIVVAITLSVLLSGVITMYYWRKNKGIARARPYDVDGTRLSAGDGNDEFSWMSMDNTRDTRID